MTKAWDFQDLLGRVKAKALPIAALVAGDVIDWTAESLQKNQNGIVKALGGVVAGTKQQAMDEINKYISSVAAKNVAGKALPQAQDIV